MKILSIFNLCAFRATNVFSALFVSAVMIAFVACGSKETKDDSDELRKEDEVLVVNEVMASNRTGLMADDGQLYDWIEVKNVSDKTLSLDDYSLVVLKDKKDKKDKKKNKDEKSDKSKADKKEKAEKKEKKEEGELEEIDQWSFPEMELAPGALAIVFASKRDVADAGKAMHTNFKISDNGGRLQVRKGRKGLVTELRYPALHHDECFRRQSDGSYEKSYEQTPGFTNDAKGYEAYNELLAKQREGSPLLLWEVYSKGAKVKGAKGGGYQGGWIEVKNVSDKPVELKDYCLATKPEEPKKWSFPEKTLKPGEVYVVESVKHKFKIGDAETILLTKNGKFVDGVCTKYVPYGVSVGRKKGKAGFFFYRDQTRGRENDQTARRFIAHAPTFNIAPGVYDKEGSVTVKLNTYGRTVHYTTDGSAPSLSSRVYKEPIVIKKTTVIRAYAEGGDNHMRSSVATGTYFIGEKRTIPLVNISVNPGDLFDRRSGIYMPGPGASSDHPHYGANYWSSVTRAAHVEFYDGKGGSFDLDCGIAIFGGFSRAEAKKSFKLKFKDIYGPDELTYDVFGRGKEITLKNMVLRSGSQDIYGVMARDEYFTSLMSEACPDLLVQDYRPIALYINAEYFGLYYIREKIDKHYVARHLGVSNDSVRIVMAAKYYEEGPDKEWKQLFGYIKSKDMRTAEAYKYVCDRMDVQAIADHNIAEIYTGNNDMGNVRYVYSPDPKGDQKWHVVFYDVDASWSAFPSVGFYLRTDNVEEGNFCATNNVIINRLLRNKDFRRLYLERLSLHLHKTFEPKHATSVFDALMNTIRPEIAHNGERWPKILPASKWEKNVETFRAKFETRPKKMLNALRKELNITADEDKKYFSDLGY